MKSIKYKITLNDSLLHFLRKENILGLFLYSVFLVETYDEYKIEFIYTMPSWTSINVRLRNKGLQEINWIRISECIDNLIEAKYPSWVPCYIVDDFGCMGSNCPNFNNNICNILYIPFSTVKYTLPSKKDWIYERR